MLNGLSLWLFPVSSQLTELKGKMYLYCVCPHVCMCALMCAHTDIHIYTYFYISTFVSWNIYIYIHVSNSNPIRLISLAFCLSLFLTFFFPDNKKPGLFWACSISHLNCKESPNFITCGGAMLTLLGALTFLPGYSVSVPSSSCSTRTAPHPRPPSLTPSSPYLDS